MKKARYWMVGLLLPLIARANPVAPPDESLIAALIVGVAALTVESAAATAMLLTTGIAAIPFFLSYTFTNLAVYAFVFYPMTKHAPIASLELAVVIIDGLIIKLLTRCSLLQSDRFLEVSLKRALVASLIGNCFSFFVGYIV